MEEEIKVIDQIFYKKDSTKGSLYCRKDLSLKFTGYQNLAIFANGKGIRVCITEDNLNGSFVKVENNTFVVNKSRYMSFVEKQKKASGDIANAFFYQNIDITTLDQDGKKKLLNELIQNSNEEELNSISNENKNKIASLVKVVDQMNISTGNITNDDADRIISDLINNPEKANIIIDKLSNVQISALKQYKDFLQSHLVKDETFIQSWIDGKIDDNGSKIDDEDLQKKLKKSRCLIFGLEYINHKSQGVDGNGKKFDVLMSCGENQKEYTLIELKSPCVLIFDENVKNTKNDGESYTYCISGDLSRAIPQVLSYKTTLESDTGDEAWRKIGFAKGKIKKCIIVIGKTKENDIIWQNNFKNLQQSFNSVLEILTYNDLILKLETTIKNLEENL